MKPTSTPQKLSNKLRKYTALNKAYCLSAKAGENAFRIGAAGSAMLLTAQGGNAAIVYTDLTPDVAVNTMTSYLIDFDGGGADVRFVATGFGWAYATGVGGAQIAATGAFVASPLGYGSPISSAMPQSAWGFLESGGAGAWLPAPVDAYVGVIFNGGANVGWVHVISNGSLDYTITEYAYETSAGVPLGAGVSAALPPPPPPPGVPTLSEWGLLSFILFGLSFGTIFLGRKEETLEFEGVGSSKGFNLGWSFQKPPFNWAILKKTLLGTGVLGAILGAISIATTGTITITDLVGASIAGPLLAYFMHLLIFFEKEHAGHSSKNDHD